MVTKIEKISLSSVYPQVKFDEGTEFFLEMFERAGRKARVQKTYRAKIRSSKLYFKNKRLGSLTDFLRFANADAGRYNTHSSIWDKVFTKRADGSRKYLVEYLEDFGLEKNMVAS